MRMQRMRMMSSDLEVTLGHCSLNCWQSQEFGIIEHRNPCPKLSGRKIESKETKINYDKLSILEIADLSLYLAGSS